MMILISNRYTSPGTYTLVPLPVPSGPNEQALVIDRRANTLSLRPITHLLPNLNKETSTTVYGVFGSIALRKSQPPFESRHRMIT